MGWSRARPGDRRCRGVIYMWYAHTDTDTDTHTYIHMHIHECAKIHHTHTHTHTCVCVCVCVCVVCVCVSVRVVVGSLSRTKSAWKQTPRRRRPTLLAARGSRHCQKFSGSWGMLVWLGLFCHVLRLYCHMRGLFWHLRIPQHGDARCEAQESPARSPLVAPPLESRAHRCIQWETPPAFRDAYRHTFSKVSALVHLLSVAAIMDTFENMSVLSILGSAQAHNLKSAVDSGVI